MPSKLAIDHKDSPLHPLFKMRSDFILSFESSKTLLSSTCHSRPFNQALPLTTELTIAIRPSVLLLLLTSCPSTVAWFVVAVVVDSIDRVTFRRSIAHISNKILERIFPAIAHFNSSAAVAMVFRAVCVFTAIVHALPDVILGFVAVSMLFWVHSAAARSCVSGSQVPPCSRRLVSAIARSANLPKRGLFSIRSCAITPWQFLDNRQSTKSIARIDYNFLTHVAFLLNAMWLAIASASNTYDRALLFYQNHNIKSNVFLIGTEI